MITAGNVAHILQCTSERLDILMDKRPGQDRVYQWAPLNFAAAWITTLTSLLRGSSVFMNTDLAKIAAELRTVRRIILLMFPLCSNACGKRSGRTTVEDGVEIVRTIYLHAKAAYMRKYESRRPLSLIPSGLAIANAGGVSDHPQKDDWLESEGPHLRLGSD